MGQKSYSRTLELWCESWLRKVVVKSSIKEYVDKGKKNEYCRQYIFFFFPFDL